MPTLLCSGKATVLTGCSSAGGVGFWLGQHGEPQGEGTWQILQAALPIKDGGEQKGVLWAIRLGFGLGLSAQRPSWGKLVFIM